MSQAKLSNGTLLEIGDGGSPVEVFTVVPEVMKIKGPSVKFDLLDVSSHDTVGLFREYIPGFSDGDVISGQLNWRPSNTVHIAMRQDSQNAALRNFTVIFPDISDNTVLVSTYIQNLEPQADAGKQLLEDFSIKITGAPQWS